MHWIALTDIAQLDELVKLSFQKPVAVFKHSTSCSISVTVKKNFEKEWGLPQGDMPVYYLDLLTYRPISNRIAEQFGVQHQSPQIIIIKDGKAVYNASHADIDASTVADLV